MRRVAASFILLLSLAPNWAAERLPPPPRDAKAPLLFSMFIGPEGLQVALYEGPNSGHSILVPANVGFRPGYVYRARVYGPPLGPNAVLYASLEVYDTLTLPPRLRAARFPAVVSFDSAELNIALRGAMVTKAYVLESADNASGFTSGPGQPITIDLPANFDPAEKAGELGRPLMIVRLGQREPSHEQLSKLQPGLILFPGKRLLPPMKSPPPRQLPPTPDWDGPSTEDCVRDGGDRGRAAHLTRDGRLRGLDPTDSVAEFTDSMGRRQIVPSNVVCVRAPRILTLRHFTAPLAFDWAKETGQVKHRRREGNLSARQRSGKTRQLTELQALNERKALNANVVTTPQIQLLDIRELKGYDTSFGPARLLSESRMAELSDEARIRFARQTELATKLSRWANPQGYEQFQPGPHALGKISGVGNIVGRYETRGAVYVGQEQPPVALPEQPLILNKWASAESAQPGDTITFFIRYSNMGGSPIQNVAVTDHLSPRLDYIPGTAASDREAVFVTQQSDQGTIILRWEIRSPLPPGRDGVVKFDARLR